MEENQETTNEQIEETKSMHDKVLEETESSICNMLEQGISTDNLDIIYKLVDIHKDICNEKYWKVKECEIMRYDNYGRYNEYGRYNDSGYGNYSNYNNYGRDEYGRRGVDAKYRGHDHMDRMYNEYSRYEDGREQYNRGNYGAKDETLTSLKYMLESMQDFVKMLKSEANSQEEMQLIREYTKKISEM